MKRRKFLQSAALASSATMVMGLGAGASPSKKGLSSIGIQLFSLPKLLENDLEGSLALLRQMGYTEIEIYGPYPFSSTAAWDRWKQIVPSIGFSGSGFFGKTAEEFKALLDEHELRATSGHIDLVTLETDMPTVGQAVRTLGLDCFGISAIPEDLRQSLDDYKRMADRFNKIGENAKKEGFKFLYHNHGYGLHEMDGRIPLDIILDNTDPELVFFEMDIYWTTAGGMDPVELLKANPGRYIALHLKDMKEITHFEGDGGTADQWIALWPQMTTVGSGAMDIPSIITQGQKSGVKHFFVEQDLVENPSVALQKSIDYLRNL
ncbi:sugar phosphate isomerase/epimerase family protein [Flagellimonas meishanensis]|uniref:sugar phosphate isomerase/epimerase family protein n=1 Tax=Flagellimonas meishanensis TaxID=2873264 RepID=UPI001CA7AADA|nr:sugar phosphate isomerase/epimerase [[Muricauda] meishanensis]